MFNNNKNLFIIKDNFFLKNKAVVELKSHYKIEVEIQQNLDN